MLEGVPSTKLISVVADATADRLYLDYVGKDTFYGLLASLRGQLFSDDDFAEIYCHHELRRWMPAFWEALHVVGAALGH